VVQRQIGEGDKNKIPASITVPHWVERVRLMQHVGLMQHKSDRFNGLRTAVSRRSSAA
jgi:hypothetical protein